MRKLVLAPTLLFALVSAPAIAEPRDEAAIRADSSSFELFGTRFCYGPAEACDVTLAAGEPEQLLGVVVPGDGVPRVELFGITFCAEVTDTGPACDVAWVPPQPAARWRDMPELRVLAALD